MKPWANTRSGTIEMIPAGIDPEFAHNPGMIDRRAEAEKRLQEKQVLVVSPARPAGGADAERIAVLADEAKRYVLERGRETGNEWLDVYDLDTGQILERFSGEAYDRVLLPARLIAAIKDPRRRLVLHHNHPVPASFSEADLRVLAYHPGVARLLAHADDGSDFAASFPGPRGQGDLTDLPKGRAIQEGTYSVSGPLSDAVKHGEIDRESAELLGPHLRALALARRGVIDYTFVLGSDISPVISRHAAPSEVDPFSGTT